MEEQLIDIADRKLCTERFLSRITHKVFQYFGLYHCIVCNSSSDTICSHCYKKAQYISPSCWFCNQHTKEGFSHIKCRDSRGWYDRKIYLYAYTKIVKQLYRSYKFNGAFLLQHILYSFAREYIEKDPFLIFSEIFNSQKDGLHLLVPVPMSKRKKIERGFSPAEELAIIFGRELIRNNKILPVLFPTLFKKLKETLPQAKKNRVKRLISIQHAFTVDILAVTLLKELIRSDKSIIVWIVDDVHTTGATSTILIELLTSALGSKLRNNLEINFVSFAKA